VPPLFYTTLRGYELEGTTMTLPTSIDTKAKVLTVLRRVHELAHLALEGDERFAVAAGLTPKTFLAEYCNGYPTEWVRRLVAEGKVWESETYLKPNPRVRTHALPTRYDIDKPRVSGTIQRYTSTYKVRGKDKLLLWYAAANRDLTGSLGEPTGLILILDFFRSRPVQRIWKRLHPGWRLPEDAD
jgi:hypothetical protein